MISPTYGAAVLWIARNDAPGDDRPAEDIAGYISTVLVADMFGKAAAGVGLDVYRCRHGGAGVMLFRPLYRALRHEGMTDLDARALIERGVAP